jgi:hypothetical protein
LTGLIKFAAFSAALIALLVFVVIPVVAGPIISGLAHDAGLEGDDVEVSVDLLGPGILSGRAPSVRIQGNELDVPRAVIGRVDLTLTEVSLSDRTFETVSGTLYEVRVTGPGDVGIVVETIDLEGPAEATRATGRLDRPESEALVREIASQAGLEVDDVIVGDGSITFQQGGRTVDARLRVTGDALILDPVGVEPIVLLAPAPSDSWRLSDVIITPDGMTVDLTVDVRDLASQLSAPPR